MPEALAPGRHDLPMRPTIERRRGRRARAPSRTSVGSSRGRGTRDEFARARARRRRSSSAASRTTDRRERCAECTTRRRRTRRPSSSAARQARSSTSPSTFGPLADVHRSWFGVELSAENRRALYMPEGCAHGFLTLADDAEVLYQITERVRARGGAGRALGRPGVRDRRGPARSRVINERDRPYPDFVAAERAMTRPRIGHAAPASDARVHDASSSRSAAASRATAPGDAARDRRADPARAPRGAEGHAGPRLDGARRVEHPRCLRRDAGRRARRRLPRVEPPRRQLQRAGAGEDDARRAEAAPAHSSRATRTGSRTARRTTRGPGASACRNDSSTRSDDGTYEVVVDSTLEPGSLTYGECVLPGRARRRGPAHAPMSAIPRSRTTTSPGSRS